ncbi:carboxypeptidase regulatory-like domain-containing protein [Nocardioides lijunqiniae]|uniref:carboxypeptidase regulatory-like domain-containing protein n=1 Tax=Nocardioides lijunqiniae TaxID=2760832 RepID=UPI00187891E8|nr:carboxypeptidase regulatory-like domain-containing protein [Nocardioides lijunqiniae]
MLPHRTARVLARPRARGRLVALALGPLLAIAGLAAVPAPASAAAPTNDDFADAQVLDTLPATVTGDSTDATREPNEPSHADAPGGASVWFSWTAAANGFVSVDPAGTGFDTVVGVYTGPAVGDLSSVAAADDGDAGLQGAATFEATQGTTYRIALDSYNGSGGAFTLTVAAAGPPTGAIRGQVTDATAEPLSGICVDAYATEGQSARQALTDGTGYYTLADLPVGDYRVRFSDCGTGAFVTEFYDDVTTYDDASSVRVRADAQTGSIGAQLAAAGSSGSISGRVVDRNSNGLAGVCVDAYSAEGTSAGRIVTDDFGDYRIYGLAAGTYRVGFGDCGSGAFPEFFDDVATYALAKDVTVVAGTRTKDVDAQVSLPDDPAIITGRVTDDQGAPLANICVTATVAGQLQSWQVRTDGDGRYSVEVIPETFIIDFLDCGLGYPIQEWYDSKTAADADTFAVTTGRPTVIDASMVIGGHVTGTVRNDAGAVLPNICVDLWNQNETRAQDPVVTGSNGTYRFRDIVPGTYVVGYRNCRNAGPYADEFHADAATFATATPVVVPRAGTAVADGTLERIPEPDTEIVTGPVAGSTIASTTATFTFASVPADAARSFGCQIDSRPWAVCTNPKTFTNLAQGSHTFRVYAIGAGGVEDPTEATRTFRVDTVAPNTVIDTGVAEGATIATTTTSFTFRGTTTSDTAKIQCQLDDAAWADCTSPLALTGLGEGAHTVRFRAQDAVGNADATPATRSFRVDTLAPDTTVDSGPDDGATLATGAATYAFSGTAGDTAKLQCRVDEGAWADCTSPLVLSGQGEGEHTVRFRAQDAAGNADATPSVRTFTVDTTAPDTTVDSGPADGATLTTDEATFAFSGTTGDTAKLQCRVGEGAWADCTSPVTFSDLGEGDHTVAFRAQDRVGNVDATPATRSFTVDTTAPDTTVDSGPAEGAVLTADAATFTFSGTAGDTDTFQCRVDDGEWTVCASPLALTDLAEGEHTVRLRALDAAGNADATPVVRTFTVDTVAPETRVDSGPADGATLTTGAATFTFSGTAGDTDTFQCRVDDGEWADCTSPLALTGLVDGEHTVRFRAQDAAGNADATPSVRTFTVDTAAPDTTVDSGPAEGAVLTTRSATFTFAGTAGETALLQCRIDDGEWADCTSPATFAELADGQHTVRFRAQDAAGNADATPATRTFTVDTTAPDTTVDSGPADGAVIATGAATYTFSGSAGDTDALQCRVDDGDWASCTSPLALTGLADGGHTVRFRAQDAVGNADASPAVRTFTVDTTAPETTVDSGPADGTVVTTSSATYTFSGTAGDTDALQCRVDEGEWASCTSPLELNDLAQGDHTVRFRARDAAGNIDATPAVRTFTVDTGAPETTVDSGPADGAVLTTSSATFGFSGTAGDTAKLQCRLDEGDWAGCASPATFGDLAEGRHTVRFRAQDAAGNADATPAVRTFTVDTVAPDTVVDSGPAEGSVLKTRSATFGFSGTAGDTAALQCRVDARAWADCTSPATFGSLTDGAHTVAFRAVDAAGNVDASPATRTFRVQVPVVVTPPAATATQLSLTAPRSVKAGKKVTLKIKLTGVTSGTVVIRDGRKIVRTVVVKGKLVVKLKLKPGKHRLKVTYAGTTRAKPSASPVRVVVVKRARR